MAEEKCVKRPFELPIEVTKGYKNVAISREFADFVLDHPVAGAFRDWLEATNRTPSANYGRLI